MTIKTSIRLNNLLKARKKGLNTFGNFQPEKIVIAKGEIVMVGERFGVRFTEVTNPEDTVKKL